MSKNKFAMLDAFEKDMSKVDGLSESSLPPEWWISSGNYVLNRIMSGNYHGFVPQSRLTCLTGPSGAGKSYLLCNIIKHAQEQGFMVLVLDSEEALDDAFVSKIGVNPSREVGYVYRGVKTIPQVTKVVSNFLKHYRETYTNVPDAPPVLIVLDSLDMLMTETEQENYDKGIAKGDQGQRNKQLKAMLRSFVHDIKSVNAAMVCTAQVYKNQDLTNGEGLWIVSDAVKYSMSQITMVTKLKLKDKTTGKYTGVRIKGFGYKTRFARPFSSVELFVPYDTGMDPYSGLVEVAIAVGALIKKGSRYQIAGEELSWYEKDIAEHGERLLAKVIELDKGDVLEVVDASDEDNTPDEQSATARRRAAAGSNQADE